jgi:hypothetical protein
MLNKETFGEGMSLLCEVFERQPTRMLIEAYYMVLKDLTDDEFQRNISGILSSKLFSKLPLPAEILNVTQTDLDDQAILAYDKFTKGKAQTGPYQTVIFDDITIHAVVDAMGSWESVCFITEDEWKFKRREFLDLYKAFKKNPRTDTPQKLIGLIEGHNLRAEDWRKYIGEPVYIGFEDKKVKQLEEAGKEA